jgi:hypothetical protein
MMSTVIEFRKIGTSCMHELTRTSTSLLAYASKVILQK